MKISPPLKREQGLTLVELFVVVVVISLLAIVFTAQPDHNGKSRALRIQCVMNLKQVGLAYRVWEGDHGDSYPMAVSETNGGTMEFLTGQNAFRNFLVMSNELSNPKILFCPAETDRSRSFATSWAINNSNITYFVGIDATETNPEMILSGDHNITNGAPLNNGLLELTSNHLAGWTAEMHNKVGNLALADGSVQQASTSGLHALVASPGVATNRLQMPILNP